MRDTNRPECADIYRVRLRYMRRTGTDRDVWADVDYYAIVPCGGASELVAEAADLAMRAVIGPPESWAEHHPVVLAVEYVGTGAMRPRRVASADNRGS